jgi:hypothetical protein
MRHRLPLELRSALPIALAVGVLMTTVAVVVGSGAATAGGRPACEPGADPVELSGEVEANEAKSYLVLPVEVVEGTTRIEVGYAWESLPADDEDAGESVFDLGLWDADGYRAPDGFRGWSGSRQGKVGEGQDPVFVQADDAERGYLPGRIEPGTWHVELGVAAVAPSGAAWEVTVRCLGGETGEPVEPDPVDPGHVADAEAGWYHGDFHMHGYHSNREAPSWDEFVEFARDAGLDFLPVTEYVTSQHWYELGATQRDNPDLLVWPGREIITYFGHATALGETPDTVEYRHGFEDVSMADIQAGTVEAGALFGVAHPTIFPEETFGSACRGCEFNLGDVIDWDQVDYLEVVTEAVLVGSDLEAVDPGEGGFANPFVATAIDLWEERLLAGHRITAVSGSDDKLGPELGSSATAVYAEELSRPALTDAVRAGHAYVRTRGVDDSPELELEATTSDGQQGIFGDTLVAAEAEITVTVTGGDGQVLRVVRNGAEVDAVPVAGDPFTHTFTADRGPDEGPLGTFWRVETDDGESLTTIGNPLFLADRPAPEPNRPPPAGLTAETASGSSEGGDVSPPWAVIAVLAAIGVGVAAGVAATVRRRR